MVIERGGSYGVERSLDPTWPSLGSDADLARHISHHGRAPCTLTKGDVLTTLGGGAPPGVPTRAYPLDVLDVELDDGTELMAVAHVVVRRGLWSGRCLAAMNAAWVDGMYLGPRSHPNDGLVDWTVGRLGWQQRLLASKRARTGTHLPHPDLKMRRTAQANCTFERPTPVRVDGVFVGKTTAVSLTVRPDAGLVVV